jgi:hypothetical protein
MKKIAQICQILKKILPITRFLLLVLVSSQKYFVNLIFSYFHISTCGEIWLKITFEMIATSATSQNWKKKPQLKVNTMYKAVQRHGTRYNL